MSSRTVFLSKLFGLYYIFAALAMILHKQSFVETVRALVHNSSIMLLGSMVAVLGGLALIFAHNIWSRGALAVIVTLIGWITLAKGLLALFLTPEMQAEFFLTKLHYAELFYMYAGISLILGVYLAYGGFTSTSSTSHSSAIPLGNLGPKAA
jgi:hypothetical protein